MAARNENRSGNLACGRKDAPQAVSVAEIEAQMIRAQKAEPQHPPRRTSRHQGRRVKRAQNLRQRAKKDNPAESEKANDEDDQYERLLAEQRAREKA